MKNKIFTISVILLLITTLFSLTPSIYASNQNLNQSHNNQTYNLTLSIDCAFHDKNAGGSIDPGPGVYSYDAGTQVDMTLTATPNQGWILHHWGEWCHDLPGESYAIESYGETITISITMNRDYKFKAYFRKPPTCDVYTPLIENENTLKLKGEILNDGDGDISYRSCCLIRFRYRVKGTSSWQYFPDEWEGRDNSNGYNDGSNSHFERILSGLMVGETYEVQAGTIVPEFGSDDDINPGWSETTEKIMDTTYVKPSQPTIVTEILGPGTESAGDLTAPQYSILLYRVTATHIYDCKLKYGFDLDGDEEVDYWKYKSNTNGNLFEPGVLTTTVDYIDLTPGNHIIRVKAATFNNHAESNWTEITLSVTGGNSRPTISADECNYKQMKNKLTLKANDEDGDEVYYYIVPNFSTFDNKNDDEIMGYSGYLLKDGDGKELFSSGVSQTFELLDDPDTEDFFVRAMDKHGTVGEWTGLSYKKSKTVSKLAFNNILHSFFEKNSMILQLLQIILGKN